jgi:glutathione peroxidase
MCDFILGLTKSNYRELQQIYERFGNKGFEILAFPCDTFRQELSDCHEIIQFVRITSGVTFPLMEKVDCSGSLTHSKYPLFPFLCEKLPDTGFAGLGSNLIKWNFTKFLCDGNGIPLKRYGPRTSPLEIENDIAALLDKAGADEE